MRTIFCLLTLSVLPLAAAVDLVDETWRDYSDPERSNWLGTGPRPLRTLVLQPATTNDAGPLPLVLLSHGSGSTVEQLRPLGRALATGGYIAALVSHNGSSAEELGGTLAATDFFAWERARDLSVVLDRLLADPSFAAHIDSTRIGAAGFSLGGTTVLWLGGARLDLERLRTESPPPPPFLRESIDQLIAFSETSEIGRTSLSRAAQSFHDPRVKSIFAHAPAMGPGFPESGLQKMNVPVLIVVGDADVVAPAATNAAHFGEHIPGARLVTLPGELGHYTRPIAPEVQATELAEVGELALKFFAETLPAIRSSSE